MSVQFTPLQLSSVNLDDKYKQDSGRWYMTGTQALVKVPLLQRALDMRDGLNTGGFISGYRGSPLSGYDQQLWRAGKFLEARNIKFQPGVNEELAATAVWGSQQVNLHPGAKVDGVFGIYYAKKMGIDRSADALHHANAAGSSPLGGVLALGGDDHAARSASLACQSELIFSSAMMPTLNPASIQDYLELGLHGIAMSRYSGFWSAMIVLAETIDGSASISFDLDAFVPQTPNDYTPPPGGLHIRWPDAVLAQEERMMRERIFAVHAYARANRLNKLVIDPPQARFGIATTGKSYLDVREALIALGIDDRTAERIGLRLLKIDLIWPLEPDTMRSFAEGLEEILVVEEKRPTIEPQLKDLLFNAPTRPRIVGKTRNSSLWATDTADWLLPPTYELNPRLIAEAIASRLLALGVDEALAAGMTAYLERTREEDAQRAERAKNPVGTANENAIVTPGARTPYYCSGCPHNTSTRVPEGSRAIAGIGCHFMAMWIYPEQTSTFAQMGGEGVTWVGQAPFTDTKHVFTNLGDGTYYHSGLLAIRQSVAAKVNVTYKLLYNDAVAMTGGQPVEGGLSVAQITGQLLNEGVSRLVVVTDEPEKYNNTDLKVDVFHRDRLDKVQRDLRDVEGCTVLIYDQTCAAEKRRRRKRNDYPDPAKRVVINPAVCEGCGDCSVQSNCISIIPVETSLGTKRAIDQSTCNKDFSCVKGFCPSFVTVTGGALRRKTDFVSAEDKDLPLPEFPDLATPRRILVSGIGGTGVITVGALIGMAAHLDGKATNLLDMTGLAQKGGAVFSHIQIAHTSEALYNARLESADAVIACEVSTTAEPTTVEILKPGQTRAFVNTAIVQAAAAKDSSHRKVKPAQLVSRLASILGKSSVLDLDAGWLAEALIGDTIFANMLMLGFAWQQGELPLSLDSLLRAIELNGVEIERSKEAFTWGRRAALDLDGVIERARQAGGKPKNGPLETVDALVADYRSHLRAYQGAALERRFSDLADRIMAAERRVKGETGEFSMLALKATVRMMAIKDEFEVARLLTEPGFLDGLNRQFEGDFKLTFNLAPPSMAGTDPDTGTLAKKSYAGRFMLPALRVLAAMRGVRGTVLDPFRYTVDRREQIEQRDRFERHLATILETLSAENYDDALNYLRLADRIRGYGHIRQRNAARVEAEQDALIAGLAAPRPRVVAGREDATVH